MNLWSFLGFARRPTVTLDAGTSMLEAINVYRASRHLPLLEVSFCLNGQAAGHAARMQLERHLTHLGMMRRLSACGEEAGGECVAEGQADAALAVAAWMQSPPHRALILGRFAVAGCGQSGDYYCLLLA